MGTKISLYSVKNNEINRFLTKFFDQNPNAEKDEWEKEYSNPIEMADLIGVFLENNDQYNIAMWVSLDPGIFIHITDENGDKIIRYLYERYPN